MNIEVSGLTKVFKGGTRALDAVDLQVSGGVLGLIGPNGAGKTTLMRILTGSLRPTTGHVAIGGHDLLTNRGRHTAQRDIGYLPQALVPYPDLTGREFLDHMASLKGISDRKFRRSEVEDKLCLVELKEWGNRRIAEYSGGMRQRIGIAQSLLGDPRILVVDEPTAGLDPEERRRFRSLLSHTGRECTIVLGTQILEDVAQISSRTAVLSGGRLIFQGTVGDLVDVARGLTYEVPVDLPLEGQTMVVGTSSSRHRVVTLNEPPRGVPVPPTVQDGYIALVCLRS